MALRPYEWRPGSFTKNFSWGPPREGLRRLHKAIRAGFDSNVEDVPRDVFRARIEHVYQPDYIPLNFFLFNVVRNGESFLLADELVFQAVNFKHSPRFDRLGLYAFNLSLAGRWVGARDYQRHPTEWAWHYINDRVAGDFRWDVSSVNADDIERFVSGDKRYIAQGARKLATNLNYLYQNGRLKDFNTRAVELWWLDALFLTLDRLIEDRRAENRPVNNPNYMEYLIQSGFPSLSGPRSLEKDLATSRLITLYDACGGRERFSEEHVRQRTAIFMPDLQNYLVNRSDPIGAVHPSNPRILKAIPRACAMLARYVGFEPQELDDLGEFNVAEFVRDHTERALEKLRAQNISPTMSAEELLRLTREE